jgi:hypothetical protein
LFMSEHAPADAEYHRTVPPHQRREGRLLPLRREALQQDVIGRLLTRGGFARVCSFVGHVSPFGDEVPLPICAPVRADSSRIFWKFLSSRCRTRMPADCVRSYKADDGPNFTLAYGQAGMRQRHIAPPGRTAVAFSRKNSGSGMAEASVESRLVVPKGLSHSPLSL